MKRNVFFGLITFLLLNTLLSLFGEADARKLAESDKYKVIKVDGRIIFQRTKADMKIGDIFVSGTELSFTSPQSRAAVISSLKGRFVLSASEKGQTKILPAANNISSRSGALINLVDLQNHFLGDYVILDQSKLEIGAENFPMNDSNFFYLSFEYNGEKIRKRLDYEEGNIVVFSKDDIYKIDGQPIPVQELDMALYYRSGASSTKISEFKPVFPNLDNLKDEVVIILEEFSDKSVEIQIQEVTAYLGEFYGKPQKENLNAWLEVTFGLKAG